MKLIDEDALVAEIKKLIDEIYAGRPFDALSSGQQTALWYIKSIMSSINTFEVKEADLDKALSELDKDIKEFVTTEEFENESATAGHYWAIAKHAFLLGLKAQKGE